jgi:hypothetical protein
VVTTVARSDCFEMAATCFDCFRTAAVGARIGMAVKKAPLQGARRVKQELPLVPLPDWLDKLP